ncbi:2-dehydropantoate 2-reductase [Ruegeria pomeroyi]|nr:2-dehydropantoate 2-reductase [Ruegeria pomeroyi]
MKIAIVGCGAMGSIYAARLAEAGHQVRAVDMWTEHVAAINAGGLRVDGPSGTLLSRQVEAMEDLSRAGPCDLYILATKAAGVEPAARAIAATMPEHALVLTIQNGLGAGERIARHLPADRVLLGVAEGFGAAMVGPGHARHTAMKLIRLGAMTGGDDPRLEQVAGIWRSGGFEVETFADIDRLIWEKLLCNVTLSAPCTAFGCTVADLRADPERWAVALGCMAEAYAVGRARGVAFSFDDPVAYVTAFAERVGTAKPSMLQDHEAGRRSELEAINGAIPPLGAALGIPTPYNDTLCAVIRAREAAFEGERT